MTERIASTVAPANVKTHDEPSIFEIVAGDVVCDVRFKAIDRAVRCASYEVTIANRSPETVSCRLVAIDRRNRESDLGAIEVAHSSMGRSRFVVPMGGRRRPDRMYVRVTGDGLNLQTEARLPPSPHSWRPTSSATIVVAIAAIGTLLAYAAALGLPTISLAVPSVVPLAPLRFNYALHATTRARYRVRRADGVPVANGPIVGSRGEVSIDLPADSAGQHFLVTIDASGPLGTDTSSAPFAVEKRPPVILATPARVLSLSAHRETYAGESSLLVSYLAEADTGNVSVTDRSGKTIATAPFTHAGTTRVTLPPQTPPQILNIRLSVARAKTLATSSVELQAEPTPNPSATPALPDLAMAVGATTGGSDANASPNDPFVVSRPVVGGTSFVVTIRRRLPDMRIELQDEVGSVLDEGAVDPGSHSLTLNAPKVASIETYYLSCTFTRGSADEALVRSLRVFPH